ncbi:MAG: hypothetical protein CME62_13965 [Halobacteriovoraceae bacterium]|nr:hypothetical protein [Halobacteriovoraceae bacterium]|tara:strand:- start:50 stop:481 length:432 start_codon:yes stop_codon:yes gene_type:complete
MTKAERKYFLLLSFTIFIQGLIYFIFKEFFQIETTFGPRPHALTSSLLHIHILIVPLMVFALGYLFKVHILEKLKRKKRRKSGITGLILFLLMILSGYLLQMGLELQTTRVIAIFHITVSVLWFGQLLWHSRKARSLQKKSSR